MVAGKHKSNSLREVSVKTPGGRLVTHYKKRKPSAAVCPETGQKLQGVPREVPAKVRRLSKSQRVPSRPFGGELSSKAMREKMQEKASALEKQLSP